MQIIKDNQLTHDTWTFCPAESIASSGDIIVTTDELCKNKAFLFEREGKIGVRITPDTNVATIVAHLAKLSLVELYFPDLADGRLFSHAWLLRNRYHFTGEIRASGHFVPDQVYYLSRVGVDSFAPENTQHLPATLLGLKDFSVNYQVSVN